MWEKCCCLSICSFKCLSVGISKHRRTDKQTRTGINIEQRLLSNCFSSTYTYLGSILKVCVCSTFLHILIDPNLLPGLQEMILPSMSLEKWSLGNKKDSFHSKNVNIAPSIYMRRCSVDSVTKYMWKICAVKICTTILQLLLLMLMRCISVWQKEGERERESTGKKDRSWKERHARLAS